MYSCYACGRSDFTSVQGLNHHLDGACRTPQCKAIVKLYGMALTTKDWERLSDKSEPIAVKEWRKLFGKGTSQQGSYRVYIYVDKNTKRVTWVGHTGQTMQKRLSSAQISPLPNECVVEVATELSYAGAISLEAYLLQCHKLRDPACKMRNSRHEYPRNAPKGKSAAEMREMAVGVLKTTMLLIGKGQATPVQKPQSSARRKSRKERKETPQEEKARLEEEIRQSQQRLKELQQLIDKETPVTKRVRRG